MLLTWWVSSAILGRSRLPAAVTTSTTYSSFSSSSHRHHSSTAFTLLPIASEGHPCVPLCRVTFGLRTQPNLPGGRPGPPFSTNPGNELRGSRGLLVAMATKPSPNPLNQTPISYPSELRYPLSPSLPRRARPLRCRSRRQRESLSISHASLFDSSTPSSPLSHPTCFVSLLRFSLFQFFLFPLSSFSSSNI